MSSKLKLACFLGCACVAGFGSATAAPENTAADANPYTVINDRNVFHLNPPPPPPATDTAKPVELPKVALTGFVGKGAAIRVLLAIPPAKDSKETSFTYLTLGPGDRDHDVQLIKIRADVSEVEILNSGTPQTLTRSNSLASLGPVSHGAGGGPGEKAEKSGIHRPMIPGFNPPAPGMPPAPTAAQGGGGGDSLVIGGGGGGTGASGGSGAIVSGGGSGNGALIAGGNGGNGQTFVGGGATTPASTAAAVNAAGAAIGSQLASALTSRATPNYQTPISTAPPLPAEWQGPAMAAQKAAMANLPGGGPPMPPPVQEQAQAAEQSGNQ
jgi:hypothetical protein